jgi:oxygen-independent coproporphyrinogen-3 oxidase
MNRMPSSGGSGDQRDRSRRHRDGDEQRAEGLSPCAVYIHTPFCPSKCGYCDFNSFAASGPIMRRTVEATIRQIEASPWKGRPAKTVFFGGGTPTFLEAQDLADILRAVRRVHPWEKGCEITTECNPGTVDEAKLRALRQAGFNRLSLGAQSFSGSDLRMLGRVHGPDDTVQAYRAARAAGFEDVSLDLMFALPGQSLRTWRMQLESALGLAPDHLSLYCLTIEPGTRFYRYHQRGLIGLPDADEQADMYEAAIKLCAEAGLEQYEISNFARPGRESRHNLCYWRGEEYMGYGPGAVGCGELEGRRRRFTSLKLPERFCEAVESGGSAWFEEEELKEADLRTERIMLGLRLNEGIEASGLDPEAVQRVLSRGWGELDAGRLRLTPVGRLLCTEATLELIEA